jgi:hypothetical protein
LFQYLVSIRDGGLLTGNITKNSVQKNPTAAKTLAHTNITRFPKYEVRNPINIETDACAKKKQEFNKAQSLPKP